MECQDSAPTSEVPTSGVRIVIARGYELPLSNQKCLLICPLTNEVSAWEQKVRLFHEDERREAQASLRVLRGIRARGRTSKTPENECPADLILLAIQPPRPEVHFQYPVGCGKYVSCSFANLGHPMADEVQDQESYNKWYNRAELWHLRKMNEVIRDSLELFLMDDRL